MNKNIKRTLALALAVGTVSAVSPVTHANFLTTKAYAASNDKGELTKLELETSSGSSIKLYTDDNYDNKIDSDSPEDDSYAKTSSDKVKVTFSGVSKRYVKVFTSDSNSAKGKDPGDEISLDGDKTLYVKIYDEDVSGKTVKYDDDNHTSIGTKYTITIDHRGSSSSSDNSDSSDDEASDYDDIYLETLKAGDHDIDLADDKVKYSYDVANGVDSIKVTAKPDDSDYDVYIDGESVDSSDDYEKKLSLKEGANAFEIKVKYKNDDNDTQKRIYTLTINRAAAAAAATTTATAQSNTATAVAATAAATTAKPLSWVAVGANWQYNDSLGHAVKNAWQASGSSWYYLGADGNMVRNAWETTNGKYYYVGADGAMVTNTYINGYKIGADGAWIR